MKVVLNRDVKNLGKVGDICNVADGYGRNFLLPKGYAIIANKKNVNDLQQKIAELQKKNEEIENKAKAVAEKLNNEVFNIVRQAADDDTIYGSIRTKDIYNLIVCFLQKNNYDFTFDIGGIEMQQIKALGKYVIVVYLFGNVCTNIRLNVCRIVSDFVNDISIFDKAMIEASQKTDDTKKNIKLAGADKRIAKIAEKEQKKAEMEAKKQEKRKTLIENNKEEANKEEKEETEQK